MHMPDTFFHRRKAVATIDHTDLGASAQHHFYIYLNETKPNVFLKLLLGVIPDECCDWDGCQLLQYKKKNK